MPIPLLLGAAPGLIKAGASLFGAGKRKRAEQNAKEKATQAEEQLKNFQFKNPYKNQENVFEDATVNTQAADFQAQQTDKNLAQGLDAFTQSGGGGGGAQSFASAALQASQGASADISGQEQRNQSASLQNQASLNSQEAQGEATLQEQQFGQTQQGFNIANTQLGAATAARDKAKADLVGGLSSAVGGAAKIGGANLEAGKNFFGGPKRLKDNPLKKLYGTGDKKPAISGNTEDSVERLYRSQAFEATQGRTDPNALATGMSIDPTTGEQLSPEDIEANASRLAGRRKHKSDNRAYEKFIKQGYDPKKAAMKFEKSKGYAYGTNKYEETPTKRMSPLYRELKKKYKTMYK